MTHLPPSLAPERGRAEPSQPSMSKELTPRPFLELFDQNRRSYIANAFLTAVRRGVKGREAVLDDTLRQALHNASFRPDQPDCRYRQLADAIRSHPEEARAEAEHALWWCSLSPDEQRREKAKRTAASFDIWAESQAATDKQIALLQKLGHHEHPASKASASRLIDELLTRQRSRPQTAFGEEVLQRAGLDGYGGRN